MAAASKPTAIGKAGNATGAIVSKVPTTPAASVPVKAPPFVIRSSIDVERYLNLLVYGDFGIGKTVFAAS